jgi:hypothetical protein
MMAWVPGFGGSGNLFYRERVSIFWDGKMPWIR